MTRKDPLVGLKWLEDETRLALVMKNEKEREVEQKQQEQEIPAFGECVARQNVGVREQ